MIAGPTRQPPHETSRLPFAHLNLRRNPFGEIPLGDRAALAVVDVEEHVRRLRQGGYAVVFLGDKGRGKTTHLLAIRQRFPRAAYVHVGEGEQPRIPRGNPLLIDEVQRLTRRRRRRVFRRGVSLVLGSHEDVSGELRDAGFEVQSVEAGAMLDAERLRDMLNRRIVAARRYAARVPRVSDATARAMLDRFGDDVRAIEWHLYERFQDLSDIRDV